MTEQTLPGQLSIDDALAPPYAVARAEATDRSDRLNGRIPTAPWHAASMNRAQVTAALASSEDDAL
jgi:hypothetical protein